MKPYAAAYAAIAVAMVALDMVWLGLLARPMYQQGIGHLMAEQPTVIAALLFYALYALGLLLFVAAPGGATMGWGRTLILAPLFGLVAYGTYDLTNLATLRNWPLPLSLLDMAWGAVVSTAAAAAGKAAFDRFG